MKSLLVAALCALTLPAYQAPATEMPDSLSYTLDSTVVSAGRAAERAPIAVSRMNAEQLAQRNVAASSLPQNLALQPSVVAVSECGTGVGYTSMSIRGVQGNHTCVTLNGISLSDAESQQVFWVNVPALGGILSEVHVQRGLGTAACGPGAFGAAVNMETTGGAAAEAAFQAGYGSFGTWTASASVSAQAGPKGASRSPAAPKAGAFSAGAPQKPATVSVNAAINWQHTAGYIRNAPATAWNAYLDAQWRHRSDRVQFVLLQGWQHSAITWNGVPFDVYPADRRFNVSEGDSDNYRQTHLQAHWTHDFSRNLSLKNSVNYTHGFGWYDLSGQGYFLDNDMAALRSELQYRRKDLTITAVAYLTTYVGDHYDRDLSASDSPLCNWSEALKSEADFSARAEWAASKTTALFGELQYRGVRYAYDRTGETLVWNFANPRIGVNFTPTSRDKIYAFAALGHREPARADLEAAADAKRERLRDLEAGYTRSGASFSASVNLYLMKYDDMLLDTGELDSQGYSIKRNIASAHRVGAEFSARWQPLARLGATANLTLSDNRTEGGNPILLSPSVIAAAAVTATPLDGLRVEWSTKWVGRQYFDNSGSDEALIPSYSVSDLTASYTMKTRGERLKLTFSAVAGNIFNLQYYAYACVSGVYPAAPANASLKVKAEF